MGTDLVDEFLGTGRTTHRTVLIVLRPGSDPCRHGWYRIPAALRLIPKDRRSLHVGPDGAEMRHPV